MAPIRRARNYLLYIVALAVSAVFSLFGRSAPVWAGDATADRNAKVFHEMYQVAQAGGDRGVWEGAPMKSGREVVGTRDENRALIFPAGNSDLSKSIEKATQVAIEKWKAQKELTTEEAALLSSVQTSQRLDDLSIQIDALTKALNALAKPAGQ